MFKRGRELLGLLVLLGALASQVLSSFGAFKTITPHDTQGCTLFRGPVGAEDIQTYNGVAYISSDDRRQWMPSSILFDEHEKMRNASIKPGSIYVLDLKQATPAPYRLPISGDADHHFHPHGISLLYVGGELFLYVVCHVPGPDEVRVFRVRFERDSPVELEWRRTLRHPLIAQNANDIHVRKIDDEVTLYVTILGGAKQGTVASLFEMFTKRAWSSVIRCNDQVGMKCEVFASDLPACNGINSSPDGKLLYVALTLAHKVHVYSDAGRLLAEVDTDSGVDNIDVDPGTGDLYIGAHPNLLAFIQHKDNAAESSPSQVLRMRRCSKSSHYHSEHSTGIYGRCQESSFVVDEVYLSAGHATAGSISASAVGAYEPLTQSLAIGGVFDDGVVLCRKR